MLLPIEIVVRRGDPCSSRMAQQTCLIDSFVEVGTYRGSTVTNCERHCGDSFSLGAGVHATVQDDVLSGGCLVKF